MLKRVRLLSGGDASDTAPPVWNFDCSQGLTFWINKYEFITKQSYRHIVMTPNVTDDTGVRSLTVNEAVDLRAPVIDDVTITWVATDYSGNANRCVMTVRVRRKYHLHYGNFKNFFV